MSNKSKTIRLSGGIAGKFIPFENGGHPRHRACSVRGDYDTAQICLSCMKKKCSGSAKCFAKAKQIGGYNHEKLD